jgi:hypothetical protein
MSAYLLHDEQKVHAVDPEEAHRDVWDNRDDLAFQAVQELLQFALVGSHAEIETMNSILCGHVRLLSFVLSLFQLFVPCLLRGKAR